VLLVGPAIGFVAGCWIDRKAHIYPWFTIIFILLGFVASGREVARLLKTISKGIDEEKDFKGK
jgi:F0F1-type ATP synthase assembly protein I